MKKMYICGKITGLPLEEARANFARAEQAAKELGYTPINPMTLHNDKDDLPWEDYMRTDLKAMLDCDAIMVQTNFFSSKGASLELYIAQKIKMPVCFLRGDGSVKYYGINPKKDFFNNIPIS